MAPKQVWSNGNTHFEKRMTYTLKKADLGLLLTRENLKSIRMAISQGQNPILLELNFTVRSGWFQRLLMVFDSEMHVRAAAGLTLCYLMSRVAERMTDPKLQRSRGG